MNIVTLKKNMLDELTHIFEEIQEEEILAFVDELIKAKRVFVYGLGRERLMLQAFAMRLMHLGIVTYMIGDVTTPSIGSSDLFISSAGTGYLSTVEALINIVKKSESRIVFFTAHPESELPRQADLIIKIPAQTMKDQLDQRTSLQPMGALFEQAQLLVLEMVVILLTEKLNQSATDMEKRHTNLE